VERSDDLALRILHSHEQAHQSYVDFEGGLSSGNRRGQGQSRDGSHDRAVITESSHSPSTHTSPSSKYSFFHTGTSFFRRLIPSSAASTAGLRCGAVAATTTLASPISMRPSR